MGMPGVQNWHTLVSRYSLGLPLSALYHREPISRWVDQLLCKGGLPGCCEGMSSPGASEQVPSRGQDDAVQCPAGDHTLGWLMLPQETWHHMEQVHALVLMCAPRNVHQ